MSGDEDSGEPGGDVIDRPVHFRPHQFAIVDQPQDREKDDGQQEAIDDLRDEQNAKQRQVRNNRDRRAKSDQKGKRPDKNRRLTKTARDAFFKAEGFAD